MNTDWAAVGEWPGISRIGKLKAAACFPTETARSVSSFGGKTEQRQGSRHAAQDPVPSSLSLQGPSEASSTDFILMRPKGNDKSTKYTEQTLKLQIRPLPVPPPPRKEKGLTGARKKA